jgi:hypothetical protein
MPQGVEHGYKISNRLGMQMVAKPLMPQGVEHLDMADTPTTISALPNL